jgi:tRNA(Ile)-lysidine synthase
MAVCRTINPVREKVLRYIREQKLMRAGDRVVVAVSGGADSVALLRVLLDLRPGLGIVLAVAHFNHGLRGEESEADQAFVAEFASEQHIDFFAERADTRGYASCHKLSIEAAGRELRYCWLAQLAREQRFDRVATAHTRDDQSETVLLKLLRGAGTRGLAGIYPARQLAKTNSCVVRPLLCASRAEVESYLESLGQSWREDATNLDRRFLRNRVRHELLPLLEQEYNPKIREVLSDTSEIARGEEEYWQPIVDQQIRLRTNVEGLAIDGFADLPLALQRRVVKRFVENKGIALDFEHVEKVRRCVLGELPCAELPRSWLVVAEGGSLQLRAPAQDPSQPIAYEYLLPVPGEVRIVELGVTLRAQIVGAEFARELPAGELLAADLLGGEVLIRNWQPGDRFHPAHSRSGEKLKRLFGEKRIPAQERLGWPVALCDDQIVWVRGFPVDKRYSWSGDGGAVRIEVEAVED